MTWPVAKDWRRTKVAEGESWMMPVSHGSSRFRLARRAKNEPTKGYDLGTFELELELKKIKKKSSESKGIRMSSRN